MSVLTVLVLPKTTETVVNVNVCWVKLNNFCLTQTKYLHSGFYLTHEKKFLPRQNILNVRKNENPKK